MVIYTNKDFENPVEDFIRWLGDCNNKKFIKAAIENEYKYKFISREQMQRLKDFYNLEG